ISARLRLLLRGGVLIGALCFDRWLPVVNQQDVKDLIPVRGYLVGRPLAVIVSHPPNGRGLDVKPEVRIEVSTRVVAHDPRTAYAIPQPLRGWKGLANRGSVLLQPTRKPFNLRHDPKIPA